MTITINLNPEIERGLLARAQAKGLSLADFAEEVLAREVTAPSARASHRTGQELIDVCAHLQGLLTDEEVDALISRNPLPGRSVGLE